MTVHRPTYAEIDLCALRHNFRLICRESGTPENVLAVVKADAYGHGARRIAAALEEEGAGLFGVALLEEAQELRKAGIRRPILVLGSVFAGQEESFLDAGLIPCLFDLDTARRHNAAAAAAGRRLACHLKVDTGMGRVGFSLTDLAARLAELRNLEHLHLDGVVSHLAMADVPAEALTDEQIRRFRAALKTIHAAGFAPRHVHISNSAALFTRRIPECTLVRPGISLYGGLPSEHFAGLDLRPVMHWRTAVAMLKTLPAGHGISYGHRFVTTRPTQVATLPVGYADGYNRLLTNAGEVLVKGRRAPVIGTVCMDWIMVDVTDVPGVQVGDPVTLLGEADGARITAEEWATKIGTINYEVFCQVSKRVPRIYMGVRDEGRGARGKDQ